jgi:hypothetical protein
MAMSRYVFVVLTNASGGRDDEFNEWYNKQHIPDVLKIPGFVAAQRFGLAGAQMEGATSPWRYLALYELDTDDLAGALKELAARVGTPAMVMSESLDTKELGAYVFSPITERVDAGHAKLGKASTAG